MDIDNMAYPWHTLNLPDMGSMSDAIRTGFDRSDGLDYADAERRCYAKLAVMLGIVDWIEYKHMERNKRSMVIGLFIIYWGIFQLLLGFASLLVFGIGVTAVGLFIIGSFIGGVGLAVVIIGAIRSGKSL